MLTELYHSIIRCFYPKVKGDMKAKLTEMWKNCFFRGDYALQNHGLVQKFLLQKGKKYGILNI